VGKVSTSASPPGGGGAKPSGGAKTGGGGKSGVKTVNAGSTTTAVEAPGGAAMARPKPATPAEPGHGSTDTKAAAERVEVRRAASSS